MADFTWRSAGLTDRGLVRRDNQDNYFISKDGRVYVVADGVGGYNGGATASRIAVETIEELWSQGQYLPAEHIASWIRATVAEANRRIISKAQEDVSLDNMGTTIVIVVVDQAGDLHIGHAGDSRAVLVRNGEFNMLTIDHSVVMEMHMKGQLTAEQARMNMYKHLITRCLGHDEVVDVDYKKIEAKPGDCVVLASDGLSDEMREDEIGAVINSCTTPQEICQRLMQIVLQRGAHDNTTILTIVCEPEVTRSIETIPVTNGT